MKRKRQCTRHASMVSRRCWTRSERHHGKKSISIENKHRSYCFKNYGLLHLSTQTFPKNIIVNQLLNGEKRRKSKRLPAQRRRNRSAICNDVIGRYWSRGPCPTPPAWCQKDFPTLYQTRVM